MSTLCPSSLLTGGIHTLPSSNLCQLCNSGILLHNNQPIYKQYSPQRIPEWTVWYWRYGGRGRSMGKLAQFLHYPEKHHKSRNKGACHLNNFLHSSDVNYKISPGTLAWLFCMSWENLFSVMLLWDYLMFIEKQIVEAIEINKCSMGGITSEEQQSRNVQRK